MQIETLRDLLQRAEDYHSQLQACAQKSSNEAENERVRLLLRYIAAHSAKLAEALEAFESDANLNALNTWCSDYLQDNTLTPAEFCNQPLSELSTREIIACLVQEHEKIIGLYEHLLSRLPTGHAAEFLKGLIDLERHEAMQEVKHSQQLEDL